MKANDLFHHESDEFSDRLFESTILRMEGLGSYSLEELAKFNKFQLDPDANYLRKIRETQKNLRVSILFTTRT